MSAKKMFEKLGYKQVNNDINYLIYDLDGIFELKFYKPQQYIEIKVIEDAYSTLDVEELQAINKQVEELGWLDDRN